MIEYAGGERGEANSSYKFALVFVTVKTMSRGLIRIFLSIFEWAVMDEVFHHPCETTRFHAMGVKDSPNHVVNIFLNSCF